MKVFFEGCDWVIAEDVDDAWKVWTEYCGEKREDYETEAGDFWEELPDDKEISITFDDYDEHAFPNPQKKTCAEWIKEKGRGFLCSTEW